MKEIVKWKDEDELKQTEEESSKEIKFQYTYVKLSDNKVDHRCKYILK